MQNENKTISSEDVRQNEEIQLVVFRLANEEYAIDIGHVSEIRKMISITRVPRTPEYYLGVMNLRGSVLPVIDLKNRLNLPNRTITEESRIIILKIDDISFGVTVDAVSEVTIIDKVNVEPPSSIDTAVERNFVSGVGKTGNRLLIMLNIKEIIGLSSD